MKALACSFGGLAFVALAGCGGHDDDASVDAAVVYEASAPSGPCAAVEQEHAIEGRTHVAICSYVDYATKPPSSGNHYPIWSAYRSYDAAIPEGFWVHNLEHGSVVFSYNCPNGCDADVAAAQALIDSLPDDPLCTPFGIHRRHVMTPDPNLDVAFAASAWGWTLRANCFDATTFAQFINDHYGQGPEELCNDGEDLSTGVTPGCGDPP